MANEELRLAEALGSVCSARAHIALAADILEEIRHFTVASDLVSLLCTLEAVQREIMIQMAAELRRLEGVP